MNYHEVQLDIQKWNEVRDGVMLEAIESRCENDEIYRVLLEHCAHRHIQLWHFERSAQKSYWGGALHKTKKNVFRGTNRLGQIMQQISIRLIANNTTTM